MLDILIDNCQKCDLEAISDLNNSQYFWINTRDFFRAISDKSKDSLT